MTKSKALEEIAAQIAQLDNLVAAASQAQFPDYIHMAGLREESHEH